jgi:Ca2+/Na+ antiporter
MFSLAISFGQEVEHGPRWTLFRFTPFVWNGILSIAGLAAVMDFLWGTQSALQASLFVLVFLMVNKLLTLSHLKDIPQLFVIGFLEFLAAATLTVDLWYAVAFVVYLLAAIWAMLLYHLSCEAVHRSSRDDETQLAFTPVPLTARFFWTTNAIAVAALFVSSSIFLVMPRTGFGFFQQVNGTPIRTSGFSEKVDLGVIGAVKQDPTLVMRVQFPELDGEPVQRVYLRGAAFDHYTGQSWTNTFSRRRLFAKSEDGLFDVGVKSTMNPKAQRVSQEILLEALDISVLFGLPFADEIQGPFASIETDGMGGFWLPHAFPSRFQYGVTSTINALSNEDGRAELSDYPAGVKQRFLQLPSVDTKIAELAQAVTRTTTTPYGMTMAIKQHLLNNYQYSLDVGSVQSASPIEDFLFTRKAGYCEHYATAMVVMLRTLGIPARLITGFLPGEWNEFGHYYTVRQQDAHAWVEVWFPRSGWVTFDPTPSVMKDFSSPFFKQARSLVDSIRLKWDRFVIHYSFYDQMTVAQGLKKQGENVRGHISNLMEMLKGWYARRAPGEVSVSHPLPIPMVLASICLVLLLMVILWALRNRQAKTGSLARESASIRLYERMLIVLAARGLNKLPGSTPLEFSARIFHEWETAGPFVQDLTAFYYRCRFGREPLSPHDLQQAEELLLRLARLP